MANETLTMPLRSISYAANGFHEGGQTSAEEISSQLPFRTALPFYVGIAVVQCAAILCCYAGYVGSGYEQSPSQRMPVMSVGFCASGISLSFRPSRQATAVAAAWA